MSDQLELIQLAEKWAREVWDRAADSWQQRADDLTYRQLIIRPAIRCALLDLLPQMNPNPSHPLILLDSGCGDGSELLHISDLFHSFKLPVEMYGFEPNPHLLTPLDFPLSTPITFGSGEFEDFIASRQLRGKVDIVTSIFVCQDVADIEAYLLGLRHVLREGGIGLFVFVHPDFGSTMRQLDHLHVEHSLSHTSVPWDFAAEYPIVEFNGMFYVPYFHRTVNQYRAFFSKFFHMCSLLGLHIAPSQYFACNFPHKVLPFCESEGNVYWPSIVHIASSMLAIVKK